MSTAQVPNPAYPPERVRPGAMARLLSEDWYEMTAAANASAKHVSNLARWITKARESNPDLSDEQAERLAAALRKAHYVRMGKLSGQSRRRASAAGESRP